MNTMEDNIDSKRAEMLAFLEKLVNIDSGSSFVEGVNRINSILYTKLQEWGFQASVVQGHRYGNHVCAQLGTGHPCVFLMGHMDTVFPVGTVEKRPFTLDKSQQKAYGPGVRDMKGGIVIMLYAVRALLENRAGNIRGSIRIYLNADEEPGSPESRDHLSEYLDGADSAFVFEPSAPDGALVTRRKGVGIFRFAVKGKAAHAGSEPEAGANAIEELMFKLTELIQLADAEKGTTINIGTIRGGNEPYIVPESAEASVDVRVATLQEQRRIERAVANLLEKSVVEGTASSVKGGFHRPPMEPVAGTEELKRVVCEAADSLGYKVRFTTSPRGGASDGNLINSLGVPCIDGMGPLGSGAHSPKEYIKVNSLFDKAKLAALILDKLL